MGFVIIVFANDLTSNATGPSADTVMTTQTCVLPEVSWYYAFWFLLVTFWLHAKWVGDLAKTLRVYTGDECLSGVWLIVMEGFIDAELPANFVSTWIHKLDRQRSKPISHTASIWEAYILIPENTGHILRSIVINIMVTKIAIIDAITMKLLWC